MSRVRFGTPVDQVKRVGDRWAVDGELCDGVVLASGRFSRPRLAPETHPFAGELRHAFDYPGAAAMAGQRVLVYGNGVTGLEIARDLVGAAAAVTWAYRKPRYVIEKVADGISSDWRWYTYFSALLRDGLSSGAFANRQLDRILRLAGHPADFGAPSPSPDRGDRLRPPSAVP
jgi:dimethylaniline monooxygenase (N-oxide forming)